MNSKALLKNVVLYVGLLALFSFVITYQMKSSLDTVRTQRTLRFFVPFTLQPFTDRIDRMDYVSNWDEAEGMDLKRPSILHTGDEILSVGGHPFRGLSLYVRTLVYDPAVLPVPWHGFTVTARLPDSTVRHIDFGFPHCTCGIPTLWQAVSVWVVPPVFCVMVGFATVLWRP